MTQEDKQLLSQDLCARLPYGVNIQVYYEDMAGSGYFDETVWVVYNDEPFHINDRWIENVKPYLRPMSSMTEEERTEYFLLKHRDNDRDDNIILIDESSAIIDWLNAHHFDFRGLIEKGLALEAPKDMYNTKTE